MEGLIKKGLLHTRVRWDEWIIPDNKDESVVLDGYVILFVHFHEHRLASPTGSSTGFFTTMGLSSSTYRCQ
jgi:hypothetical protein